MKKGCHELLQSYGFGGLCDAQLDDYEVRFEYNQGPMSEPR